MSDKSENCPICKNKIKDHTVENFIVCIENLINQNKDDTDRYLTSLPSYRLVLAKNREALEVVNGLLESPHLSNFGNTMNYEDLLKKLKDLLS